MEGKTITRLEWVVLVITLLTVAVMAAYFKGSTGGAQPLSVTAMTAPQPVSAARTADAEEQKEPAGNLPVNINTAGVEELETLPSIGAVRARAIVDYRAEHGPFTYVEDLRGVKGIGEGILNQIMDYVTVGGTTDGENTGG